MTGNIGDAVTPEKKLAEKLANLSDYQKAKLITLVIGYALDTGNEHMAVGEVLKDCFAIMKRLEPKP